MSNIKKMLKRKSWTHGGVWEFDWYIDVFFIDVMAYGENPFRINCEQPIWGDDFLESTKNNHILITHKNFFSDNEQVNKLIVRQKKIIEEATSLIKVIRNSNTIDLSRYEQVQKDLSLLMASVSTVFDKLIENRITTIENKYPHYKGKLTEYLIKQSSKTKHQKHISSLRKIYKRFKKEIEKNNFDPIALSEQIIDKLKKHLVSYGWLNTGERGQQPWTIHDLLSQMKEITRKSPTRKEALSLSSLAKDDRNLLENMIAINTHDNVAADLQIELDFLFQVFLTKKLRDDYDESITENLTFDELKQLLDKSVSIKSFNMRKNNWRLAWPEKGKVHIVYFPSKRKFTEIGNFLTSPNNERKNIQGISACKGIVEGIACVVKQIEDYKNLVDGEILVAQQTQPRNLPTMIKAKAIVTDRGGITSHAAIVSREFKIPSIVGTGNATEIIKSGNKIRVDANLGIVTLLDQNH